MRSYSKRDTSLLIVVYSSFVIFWSLYKGFRAKETSFWMSDLAANERVRAAAAAAAEAVLGRVGEDASGSGFVVGGVWCRESREVEESLLVVVRWLSFVGEDGSGIRLCVLGDAESGPFGEVEGENCCGESGKAGILGRARGTG